VAEWGVEKGAGPSPQKEIIFVPKIKSLCILTQFLTGRKHGWSLEAFGTRILRFNCETKLTETVQKYQKITVRSGEGGGGRTTDRSVTVVESQASLDQIHGVLKSKAREFIIARQHTDARY